MTRVHGRANVLEALTRITPFRHPSTPLDSGKGGGEVCSLGGGMLIVVPTTNAGCSISFRQVVPATTDREVFLILSTTWAECLLGIVCFPSTAQ